MNWKEITKLQSSDMNVCKFVFKSDNAIAEAVLYKYPTYEERTVICCSVMSGCPVGCRFCGTGEYFVRNLTSSEIISQVVELLKSANIDGNSIKKFQIMFMSMGEPMLNWKNVKISLIELHKLYPNAALLISTSGPSVDYNDLISLSKEIPQIGLQFSVHESTDEVRNKLVPFKDKLTLSQIGEYGYKFYVETGRMPFFNYCVHDKNNLIEDAQRLVELFDPKVFQATISVICERDESIAKANERQLELALNFTQLLNNCGYSTRTFNPAGQDDIGGGCGMLHNVQKWIKENPDKVKNSIGFGMEKVHTPCIKN